MDIIDFLDFIDEEDQEVIEYIENFRIRDNTTTRVRVNPFEHYNDAKFKKKYRFSKCFASKILDLVKDDLPSDFRGCTINPQIQVACALRYWARHQVLQCTVLRPLFAAKRFILVGDPEQLPPVVRRNAARHLGMEESLFHRLMSEEATTTLRLQYRMNQALADLANRIAYNNRLKCANQTVAEASLNIDLQKLSHLQTSNTHWMLTACSPEPKYAAVFINLETVIPDGDISKQNKTISNLEEVCLVLALVEALKEGGVRPSDIGVIAPYRDQVSLLRRTLAHLQVEASTVDQFQGRDKSVIIYSCTKKDDGQKNKKVKEDEILNDQRRLAVSVTRAKHKFIVLGNSTALNRYEPLSRLIDACHQISLDLDVVSRLLLKYKSLTIK